MSPSEKRFMAHSRSILEQQISDPIETLARKIAAQERLKLEVGLIEVLNMGQIQFNIIYITRIL